MNTTPSNVRCRDCGYDLHGLPADGDCPECGLSVTEARRARSFADVDPRWRRKIIWGCWIMASAFAFTGFSDALFGWTWWTMILAYWIVHIPAWTSWCGLVGVIAGTWLLTTRRDDIVNEPFISYRRIAWLYVPVASASVVQRLLHSIGVVAGLPYALDVARWCAYQALYFVMLWYIFLLAHRHRTRVLPIQLRVILVFSICWMPGRTVVAMLDTPVWSWSILQAGNSIMVGMNLWAAVLMVLIAVGAQRDGRRALSR